MSSILSFWRKKDLNIEMLEDRRGDVILFRVETRDIGQVLKKQQELLMVENKVYI
jgi:hypothetical protein